MQSCGTRDNDGQVARGEARGRLAAQAIAHHNGFIRGLAVRKRLDRGLVHRGLKLLAQVGGVVMQAAAEQLDVDDVGRGAADR